MKKEDKLAFLEALGKSNINVAGDMVLEKHVDYEVANVEAGGIGIQNVYNGNEVKNATECQLSPVQSAGNHQERNEERFHFVHPEIEDDEAWRIHDAMKRLVAHQKVPEICAYLKDMKDRSKIMLPPAEKMLQELIRLGMPRGDGYSESHFKNNYPKK